MMKCQEVAEEYMFFLNYGMPHDRAIALLADAYGIREQMIRRHLARAQHHPVVTA